MSIDKFVITCPRDYPNGDKVSVVKAIRILTGMGLKDSKDASEVWEREQHFNISYMGNFTSGGSIDVEIENQFRILRNAGVKVGDPVHILLQSLRSLGAQALDQGEDELANEILQLVLAEKLRRKP